MKRAVNLKISFIVLVSECYRRWVTISKLSSLPVQGPLSPWDWGNIATVSDKKITPSRGLGTTPGIYSRDKGSFFVVLEWTLRKIRIIHKTAASRISHRNSLSQTHFQNSHVTLLLLETELFSCIKYKRTEASSDKIIVVKFSQLNLSSWVKKI